MSSKIEVSRELLEQIERAGLDAFVISEGVSLREKLRDLLAAPVVERQPVAQMVSGSEGNCCIWFSRPADGTNLYTSQPAPADSDQALMDRHEAWKAGEAPGIETWQRPPPITLRPGEMLQETPGGWQVIPPAPAPVGLDPYPIADAVRASLDRKARPNVWMAIAYEAVVDKVKELNR
jgi:hypothetical protein